jgi:hypothetical protein
LEVTPNRKFLFGRFAFKGQNLKSFFSRFVDDLLLLAGCLCVLRGLALWNVVITWIVAGAMLIVFGVLIGKAKADHVIKQPAE